MAAFTAAASSSSSATVNNHFRSFNFSSNSALLRPSTSLFNSSCLILPNAFYGAGGFRRTVKERGISVFGCCSLPEKKMSNEGDEICAFYDDDGETEKEKVVPAVDSREETLLYSVSPLLLAALPGAGALRSVFGPFADLVKSFDLPYWLVHWGHPGNMAVVLFAMGGYGTYLGFRIRFSDDVEEKAKAKDLHPKLLGGMFFFFALGATGGVISLLTSDKPILESPHAVTGLIGLALLAVQTTLPTLFQGNPGLRNVHGVLGSGIMTLFLVHSALGLQLGLSF